MMNSKPQERPERNYQLHVPADFTSRERDPRKSADKHWTGLKSDPQTVRWTDGSRYENRTLFVQYRTKCKKQRDCRHAQSSCNSQPTALLHNPTVTCFIYKHAYIFTKYHTTNKCTNCMSFILNHFLKHFHCSYMFRQHIAYHHQGAHIVPS